MTAKGRIGKHKDNGDDAEYDHQFNQGEAANHSIHSEILIKIIESLLMYAI
jgi:hypothetical protein